MFEQHTFDVDLPEDLLGAVDAALERGEQVRWAVQPVAGLLVVRALAGMLLVPLLLAAQVAVVKCGLDILGAQGLRTMPLPAKLIAAGALAGALYMDMAMSFAPLAMYRRARCLAYVVTDRRAIILRKRRFLGPRVRSFVPNQLKAVRRKQRYDGRGDLIFQPHARRRGDCFDVGFMAVPDVRDAEAAVETLTKTPAATA
ncbi:MAG: hypothetical protein GX591_13420 [Planctomycetes bacterium]|nr:hypothetical protein [Planctomycetota bacterium]